MDDGIFLNHKTKQCFNLDDMYRVQAIKEIIHDEEDRCFYLLANKFDEKLGIFLVKFDENDPNKFQFFFKWKNKLDIADADIAVIRNEQTKTKELLVSYKTIYINTYNVKVVDISRSTMRT